MHRTHETPGDYDRQSGTATDRVGLRQQPRRLKGKRGVRRRCEWTNALFDMVNIDLLLLHSRARTPFFSLALLCLFAQPSPLCSTTRLNMKQKQHKMAVHRFCCAPTSPARDLLRFCLSVLFRSTGSLDTGGTASLVCESDAELHRTAEAWCLHV
jgi:hypothetical protein